MERPAKRPRIGSFLHDDEDADDELFLDPNEVNAQRDPAVLLEQSRAVASFKLKSRWEDVFAKYEKDFSGADDIINFYTPDLPEVEVDNGHLRSLADADDAKSVVGSESADLDEEERILHGKGSGGGQLIRTGPSSFIPRPAYGGRLSGLNSFAPGPPRLSTMFSSGLQFPSFSSFSPFTSFDEPLGSIWNPPELPAEAFNNHAVATTVTRRRVAVKALTAPEDDGSDEDDIIMGNTSAWMKDRGKETDQATGPKVTPHESDPASENRFPEEATPERSHTTETTSSTPEDAVQPPGWRKHGHPQLVLREPSPVVEDEPPQKTAPELSHTAQATSDGQEKVVKRAGRRKPARPKATPQGPSPAVDDEPPGEPVPEPSHVKEIAPNTTQELLNQEGRRKPGRPKTRVQESSPTVAAIIVAEAAPETPRITEMPPDAQVVANQKGRRKPGRPRKHPNEVDSLAQKAASLRQSEAMVVADSDTEILQSFPAVASDVDWLDESSNDTTCVEPTLRPAKPMFRIEVQLVRRRRPDTAQAQEDTETSLLATLPPQRGKEPLDGPSAVAGKNASAKKKRRTLPPPSAPTPREAQLGDTRRQSLPVAQSAQPGTPTENNSIAKTPTGDGVVMETQDAPASEVPEQRDPAEEPATKLAARIEQFSRNTIDSDYDFSDQDESFVPPSRAKRSTRQITNSSSRSGRGLAQRAANNSLPGSSPSIRAAFPAVKKSSGSTGAKVRPKNSSEEQPESLTTIPGDISIPIALGTPEVEDSLAKAPEDPEPSSPRSDDPLPSAHLEPALDGPQTEAIPTTPPSNQSMEKPAPAPVAALVTPSFRQSKSKTTATPSATRPSTSKRSILSLLSDSDEDELSLSLDQISPLVRSAHSHHPSLPIRSRSTAKKPPAVKRMSLSFYARATPTQKRSRLSGGWKSASTTRVAHKLADVDDGDVHRTPGGTLRRCGEDGFKCERDFCFACL
jgi:hypothetical protein